MELPFVHTHSAAQDRRYALRAQAVSFVGPATMAAGLIWAIVQPYRLTLLHPRGQSFWWLVLEPQVLVVVVGALFALFVARPLLAELEADRVASR